MLPRAGIVKYVFNIRQCFINVVDNLSMRDVTVYRIGFCICIDSTRLMREKEFLDRCDISHMILFKR